ncbi:MAG: hypothetical protein MJ116_04415 [Lachnospiraceae bacterium]|nr:hypothetical protein [Lachnospiraceae bacterium]
MRKLLLILMLSAIVVLTTGCGSRRTDEEFDEAEAIGLILFEPEEEEHTDYYEREESEESEENEPETPASPPVNAPGFVPSSADQLDYEKLIGKYTSDNGNVYSVKFYKSPKDEKVGIITVDHPKMDFKESLEITEEETNVFQVYNTQDYFVFDMKEEDYTLAFYKDGLFADITVKTKNYKKSKGFID